jgi:periplasmic protein CpxP/Spy
MKTHNLIAALALITASSLPVTVMAHDHHSEGLHHERHTRPAPLKRLLSGLDLTELQREQIQQLMQQHRTERQASAAEKKQHNQMQALLAADNFDEMAVRDLLREQQQNHLEKRVAGLKLQHQILQVLTVEQRQQLAQKRAKWQQKKQQRRSS